MDFPPSCEMIFVRLDKSDCSSLRDICQCFACVRLGGQVLMDGTVEKDGAHLHMAKNVYQHLSRKCNEASREVCTQPHCHAQMFSYRLSW